MNWEAIHYFKRAEFDSPDAPGSGDNMDAAFVATLDRLRERVGFPLIVNSGFRTTEYNARLDGSVDGSAHTRGLAVDIQARTSGERFHILAQALEIGIRRVGIGKTFVHLDMDDMKPQLVAWLY